MGNSSRPARRDGRELFFLNSVLDGGWHRPLPVLSGNLPDKEENTKAGRQVADRNGQVARSTKTKMKAGQPGGCVPHSY